MTTYIKLPNGWFVTVPASLLAEYSIIQMYLDREGFLSSAQGYCFHQKNRFFSEIVYVLDVTGTK